MISSIIIPSGDIINHKGTSSSSVIRPSDGSESLLASSVPDLQFDFLTCHFYDAGSKLHTNGVGTVSHNC